MPRAKTTMERQETRELICRVAERLFAARGVDGVGMRELGTELDLSPMALYRYFRDKAEILATIRAAAFARLSDALEQAFDGAGTQAARARATGQAYLDFALQQSDAYRLIFGMTQSHEERYPELARQSARAKAILARQAQDLMAAGLAPRDTEQVTHALWSAAHGVCMLHMAGKFQDDDSFRLAYKATMRWLFMGLRAAAGRERTQEPPPPRKEKPCKSTDAH